MTAGGMKKICMAFRKVMDFITFQNTLMYFQNTLLCNICTATLNFIGYDDPIESNDTILQTARHPSSSYCELSLNQGRTFFIFFRRPPSQH